MSRTKEILNEALNPLTKVANSIVKKLNYIETSLILKTKTYAEAEDFLAKTAAYHSNAYPDMTSENQKAVTEKVWNIIHKVLGSPVSTPIEEDAQREELEAKIYNFLRSNGGILYPLELSSKKLADAILNK